ncbi:MAG: aminotransferase class V-fold PLP-dependent enzyme [bacterium]|nr:aminotransferase class V-fold PLP-dependent enzyme [bacterium]
MTQPASQLKSHFLLDPDVIFLNHGSFGACPRPVFDEYQRWQRELERQPVLFLARHVDALLDDARGVLADTLHADADDLVFVENATTGVNIAARSVSLQPGDEILMTDHEYGACEYTWQATAAKTGAVIVRRSMPLPMTTPTAFVEAFWGGVTPRTRVIFISHITSPTALIFPVADICHRARQAGIITVIDGAHAPGQIPLDLALIDADYYTGNLHKWLCAPKGSGFLYVRREHQAAVQPTIISWGWHDDGSFIARHQKQATRDPAAYLSVPAAIAFQAAHRWDVVRADCHTLAVQFAAHASGLLSLPSLAPADWVGQMVTLPLPPCDPAAVKTRLYDQYRIEAPVFHWQNRQYVRVSVQGYNTQADLDSCIDALREIFYAPS